MQIKERKLSGRRAEANQEQEAQRVQLSGVSRKRPSCVQFMGNWEEDFSSVRGKYLCS
ncbi:hypothetical protein MA16_Dca027857 [Dendrobium catenatum]|uniref:Uncharacterized protein n=1 Tax=Dendrobium catenatum TaxID=906689 RepID=A0A2I0WA26_9ASPA|nr:hypothetical protein MA16_Dca027857 [Dendrobium catenatum]